MEFSLPQGVVFGLLPNLDAISALMRDMVPGLAESMPAPLMLWLRRRSQVAR